MRLTTRGRFAVAAMIDLALREQRGSVPLSSIGTRQRISLSYLEQLFSSLRQAQLVESQRGPGGGYTLGRKARDISVAEILAAVEKPQDAASRSRRQSDQATVELWNSLNDRMSHYLQSITLQQLVDEQVAKGVQPETSAPKVAQGIKPKALPFKTTAPNSVFALGQKFSMGH